MSSRVVWCFQSRLLRSSFLTWRFVKWCPSLFLSLPQDIWNISAWVKIQGCTSLFVRLSHLRASASGSFCVILMALNEIVKLSYSDKTTVMCISRLLYLESSLKQWIFPTYTRVFRTGSVWPCRVARPSWCAFP